MLEKDFQHSIIQTIKRTLKDCFVFKMDSSHIQGIPDLLILYKNKWGALEVKKSNTANVQPNQKYYINKLNEWSYASFISPDNKEEVLNELYKALKS